MVFSTSQQIVLASGNTGKIKEIQAILANHLIVPQSAFNVLEAEETGSTFVENAIIKARNAALHCNLPAQFRLEKLNRLNRMLRLSRTR